MGVEPAPRSGGRRRSRPGRTAGRRVRPGRRSVERGAQEQGRSPQLRRLDLRRHLHAHRQAVRDRLGRQGRIRRSPPSTTIRPSSRPCWRPARRSTCRNPRRSPSPTSSTRAWPNRSTACRAPPTTSRTSRPSPSRWRRSSGKTMGLPYFSAVWVWNYYSRHAGEAQDRQAVRELRRIHRALREGQEGRRVALSRSCGSPASASSSCRAPGTR